MEQKNFNRAEVLTAALPYIQKYHGKTVVVKYGGNAMTSPELKEAVMTDLVLLSLVGVNIVLVHGGGPEITNMANKLGLETKFVNGMRYTDKEMAQVVQMVLCGKTNKDLVGSIEKCGGRALGLSGLDGGMIKVKKLEDNFDYGYVGEILKVDATPIEDALAKGYIPVIATIGMDEKGEVYNINADTAAARIASAMEVENIIMLTDVKGILRNPSNPDTLIPEVRVDQVPGLIESGIITGGMLPKVNCLCEAVNNGTKKAVIIDGRVPHAILIEMLSDDGVGTMIRPRGSDTTYSEQLMELSQTHVMDTYGRMPLAIKSGKGSHCWDYEGNEYIDFTSGIGVNSFGFSDEAWQQAVSEQAGKVQHVSNYYYTEPYAKAAEMLCALSGMKRVFFSNSGAESNEGAIKAARKYSFLKYGEGRHTILTLKDSFHGRTVTTLKATGQDVFHNYFMPFTDGFTYVEANNCEDLKAKITDDVCAIMLEFVQGEGGVIELTQEFLSCAATLCKEHDLLLIADEVQTGCGRTGEFLCCQNYGIQPDIVTMAKGIGGGLPLGAVLFNEKTEKALTRGDHATTFGGNPVSCAGACSVLERMTPRFLMNVTAHGAYMRGKLKELPLIKEVNGLGLMIGATLEAGDAHEIAELAIADGVLVLTAKNKLRFLPPLNITESEIDEGLARLAVTLKKYKAKLNG